MLPMSQLSESQKDLHLIESPHISLSKTFILRIHWIDSFFESLRKQFSKVSKFLLNFKSEVGFFSNEERTRHFASILVGDCAQEMMCAAVGITDNVLKSFPNLPLYYEDPSFHVSIIWKLTEFTLEEKFLISSRLKKIFEEHQEAFSLKVDKISCKSGNKLIEIAL